MAAARVAYGVGATKAGTSWLHRALSRHPGCALRSVKELHYWDTFEPAETDRQSTAFRRALRGFERAESLASSQGDERRAANQARQARDMRALLAVIEGDRTDDAAYRAFVAGPARDRLAADVTPSYALLSVETLRRMVAAFPGAKVIYLVRDPVARLWSHVRMHAGRVNAASEGFEGRANAMLRRILDEGAEEHIAVRGDYPGAVARLRAAVAPGDLRVDYAERMLTAEGWAATQAFLGLAPHPEDTGRAAHEGTPAALRDDLRRRAARRLESHYDWAAREVGPLPAEWLASQERAHA